MNERGGTGDRSVFERDGYACVHCGAAADDPSSLAVHRIGDGDECASPAALVTVCRGCRGTLRGDPPEWRRRFESNPADGIFALLREVTTTQGAAVADVADFAASSTGGVDADDPIERRRYLADRRRVRLALDVVERHLSAADPNASALDDAASALDGDAASALDGDAASALDDGAASALDDDVASALDDDVASALDDDVASAFEAVGERARALQTQLDDVVTLAETAVAAAGRCHACLEPIDEGRDGGAGCSACAAPVRDASEWTSEDGAISLAALYGTVNEQLQAASATTEGLTERAGRLAELLATRT